VNHLHPHSDLISTDPGIEKEDTSALATELETRLTPDLVNFLKHARHEYPNVDGAYRFFYYINNLTTPEMLMKCLNGEYPDVVLPDWEVRDRYLWLYSAEMNRRGLM
jgi:hypothetical protein